MVFLAWSLSKSYQEHIFFVLSSFLESQRILFYTGTKKTYIEQLKNGRWSAGREVTHVNIPKYCHASVGSHHCFH